MPRHRFDLLVANGCVAETRAVTRSRKQCSLTEPQQRASFPRHSKRGRTSSATWIPSAPSWQAHPSQTPRIPHCWSYSSANHPTWGQTGARCPSAVEVSNLHARTRNKHTSKQSVKWRPPTNPKLGTLHHREQQTHAAVCTTVQQHGGCPATRAGMARYGTTRTAAEGPGSTCQGIAPTNGAHCASKHHDGDR